MLMGKLMWIITTMSIVGLFHIHVHGCWEEEREALLHIKSYFNTSNDHCFRNWKEDKVSNCCDGWDGVSCGTDGRAVTLSIVDCSESDMHLNASIFLPFQQLRELDLSLNQIVSWTEVKGSNTKLSLSLSKLETLNLDGNGFNKSILTHLSGFQSLKYLSLGDNDLGPAKLNDTGKMSSVLKNLEKLDLSNNELDGSIINILLHLNGLHSLKSLSLQFNNIHGLVQLCDNAGMRNLEVLDLSYNFDFQGFMNCNGSANWSSSLNNLKTLKLSGTNLDNSALKHLSEFPSLVNLQLQLNSTDGLNQTYDLCQLHKLQTLDLSYSHSDGMLSPCLGNLTALRSLNLSSNELAGCIPSWLGNMSALQQLDLSDNHFTGNIASSVLTNLTSLEILKLANNFFQIPYTFKSFSNHTKLKKFIADFNEIIPDSEDQPNTSPGFQLEVLGLSNCRLASYPPFLLDQNSLTIVDLSHNSLNGDFPTWLLENSSSSLKGIFLQNNSISGSFQLPLSLHLRATVALDISMNKIQGLTPENIGDVFPQLQMLYLFSNELQGKIPWSLGFMKSLQFLDLSNNSLIGTLPSSLAENYSSLEYIRVSDNHLEGEIPSFYLHQDLWYLNLRNNSLEGSISRGICSLIGLVYFDLSYNKLNGSIPSCFSNLTELRGIHLSNNKLKGPIILQYSPYLRIVDLNNNKLYGSIPTQIANYIYLQVLLLQGNKLDGEIPIQLCGLFNLVMLDLSHNNLSGSIPSCFDINAFHGGINKDFFIDSLRDVVVGFYLIDKDITEIESVTDIVDFTTKSMTYSYDAHKHVLLTGIDLSCNMLTGKIPHELGNLMYIQSMNLSHNHLWGDIPKTFSNLGHIESLDLSYNSLSGSIPTELTALHFLEVLIVKHNNLSGEIPLSTQFSTFNETNFEGNPFLCGPPLSKLCGLHRTDANSFPDQVGEDDSGWIDMETFYVTFAVTGMTMFLAVSVILWINPYWRKAWFYLATECVTNSYYFIEDVIRKIKRVRSV